MKELVLHTKKRSVIICGLSLFLMLVIVFIPLGFVTKTNNIENFQSLASAKKQAVLEICKSHIRYTEEFSNQLEINWTLKMILYGILRGIHPGRNFNRKQI